MQLTCSLGLFQKVVDCTAVGMLQGLPPIWTPSLLLDLTGCRNYESVPAVGVAPHPSHPCQPRGSNMCSRVLSCHTYTLNRLYLGRSITYSTGVDWYHVSLSKYPLWQKHDDLVLWFDKYLRRNTSSALHSKLMFLNMWVSWWMWRSPLLMRWFRPSSHLCITSHRDKYKCHLEVCRSKSKKRLKSASKQAHGQPLLSWLWLQATTDTKDIKVCD